MLDDLKKLEKRIKRLKPIPQSIVSSHIWWRLCNKRTAEEMAGIKSMVNYKSPPQSPEVIEDILIKFGFAPDYAERQVKSLRTLLKHRMDMKKR